MQNPTQYIIIILLMGYVIFKRIRRATTFQKYMPMLLVFRIILFSLISLILLWIATLEPTQYLFDLCGMALGVFLTYAAVKNIQIEKRKDGLFFRTHMWIEVGILILFFLRLGWRYYMVYDQFSNSAPEVLSQKLRYANDPVTGIVFFLLCTYYIAYYTYVYRKGKEELAVEEADV